MLLQVLLPGTDRKRHLMIEEEVRGEERRVAVSSAGLCVRIDGREVSGLSRN